MCCWARARSATFYAEQPRINSHAGINVFFPPFFNKSSNQVKLQIYASGCINRSISFGLILVSDLINNLKAVMNTFSVTTAVKITGNTLD